MSAHQQTIPLPPTQGITAKTVILGIIYVGVMAFCLTKAVQLIDAHPKISMFWFGGALVASETTLDTIDFGSSRRRILYSTILRFLALFAAYALLALE